jgi:hypothetical protein
MESVVAVDVCAPTGFAGVACVGRSASDRAGEESTGGVVDVFDRLRDLVERVSWLVWTGETDPEDAKLSSPTVSSEAVLPDAERLLEDVIII